MPHQLQARLQIIDAESGVVDRDRVLKIHKGLESRSAAQIAISILRNHVQWDQGSVWVLIITKFRFKLSRCHCTRVCRQCHRSEWLPSYVIPGHWCLGVNDSRHWRLRRGWLPEHFCLGMKDSPGCEWLPWVTHAYASMFRESLTPKYKRLIHTRWYHVNAT